MGHGAVAGGHELTVRAAADILKAGGNAFDAAIAGLWMACVCEPVLASPGGGGFMTGRDASSGAITLYDFFTQTPLKKADTGGLDFTGIHADFGTATQEFHIGHGATATPGFVPGLFAIHKDLCTLPMARLLEPARNAARDGVTVTGFQAFLSQVVSPILTANPESRALFAAHGELAGDGDTVANPGLERFFAGLSEGGMGFYRDEAAAAICAAQGGHGHLSPDDFAAYAVIRRDALTVTLGTMTAALNPPPSAGGTFIACALEHLRPRSPLTLAALGTALGAAERLRLAHRGDSAAMLEAMGIASAGGVSGGTSQRGTTHISVIDAAGNAASATVSNGSGNGRVIADYGFMANNMLGEEDLNRGGFHLWRENARLASNMCPALAVDADGGVSALGSGGSNRIRSAVFQVLARLASPGATPQAAVHAPRAHVENGHLDFEDDVDAATRTTLLDGFPDHRAWPERNLFFGGVHVATRAADGTLDAAGDPRRAGTAVVS